MAYPNRHDVARRSCCQSELLLAVLAGVGTLGKPRVGGSDNMRKFYQIFRPGQSRRAFGHATAGVLILATIVCTTLRSSAAHRSLPTISPLPALAADRPPEVRLRRLHLVRPDLIPYPIVYEVFC